jgi:hypothetical protein
MSYNRSAKSRMSASMGGAGFSLGSDLSGLAASALASRKENMAMEAQELNLAALRRNEEREAAVHNQQMFINNNYDAIANDVKQIDPEADDYDDRMASLPLGVRDSPLLKSKMDSLEAERKGYQVGRANAYASAIKKRKDDRAYWEKHNFQYLSSADKTNYLNAGDISAEQANEIWGPSAARVRASSEMQKDVEGQKTASDALYTQKKDNLSRMNQMHSSLSTEFNMLNAEQIKEVKAGKDLNTQRKNRRVDVGSQLQKVEAARMKLRNEMDAEAEGNASAEEQRALTAYKHHMQLGLGAEIVPYQQELHSISQQEGWSEEQKMKATKEVINRDEVKNTFHHAFSELRKTHGYIYNPDRNSLFEGVKGTVEFGDRLPSKAIEQFTRNNETQTVEVDGKMYLNPFNPPSKEEINGELLRSKFASEYGENRTNFRKNMELAVTRELKVGDPKKANEIHKLIIKALAGDDLPFERMAQSGDYNDRSIRFLEKVSSREYSMNTDIDLSATGLGRLSSMLVNMASEIE